MDNIACSYTIFICIFFLLFSFCFFLILRLLYISYVEQQWWWQFTCDPYVIAGSIDEATWQTQSVSTAAHSQHWLCSRMHKQNTLTSPFLEHTTVMQKFCQHWPSMHATVWMRFNFHAVIWVEYYTSDGTVIARSWSEQMCVSNGCCCSNCTFWVTWTVASTYFLNANTHCWSGKGTHTSLQLAHILLKSDKET